MSRKNPKVNYMAMICLGMIGLIVWIFFQLSREDEPKQQKNISVVLYHTGSDGWESLQEGMKQAEVDFSVNINYVIMREGADGKEQMATIEREIENGAEGILVAVCDYEEWYRLIENKTFNVPIVAVESGLNDVMIPLISADNYQMGKSLGEEILKDFGNRENLRVVLVEDATKRDSVEQRKQGLMDVLEGKVQMVSLVEALGGDGADVAVALHKDALLVLTESENIVLEGMDIYGIGNTASTVAALDQGKIKKLIFQNEFNVGYLGVEALLAVDNGTQSSEIQKIDYYCVSRQELYETQYERLLFPIVE